jgi:hypothetical protein
MKMKKRQDIFQVVSSRCNECLFSDNKIVDDDRKQDLIEQTLANNSYFTCHKAMLAGLDLCCRGFFDVHKDNSLVTRLAIRLDLVEFVDLPE